jgi:hypothetical protein
MHLHLRMIALHQLVCYTINGDDTDGCHVCFMAREVSAGGNAARLIGAVVCVMDVFTSDHENRAISRLFHHIAGMHMQGLLVD